MKKLIFDITWMSFIFYVVMYLLIGGISLSLKANEEKIMYLTFDDGPSVNTQAVLDILDKYQVKATFFVTATQRDYLPYIKTIFDKGHQIGVHTYSHDYATIYQDSDAFFQDISKMNQIIKQYTGKESKYLRFPGGSSNTISKKYCLNIMSELSELSKAKGFMYYDWNASNGDGGINKKVTNLVKIGKEEIGNKQEVMMLMHDGAGNKDTIEALKVLLPYYIEQGYKFKVIDNNTSGFHHHIAN